MEFKVYGHAGKPVIVFPAQAGRFYEFEDFRMMDAVHEFIDAGQYQFYTVDSIDAQSWANLERCIPATGPAATRITIATSPRRWRRSSANAAASEALMLSTGVSMGGYHSANFFFRHPDIFDALISLSGLFQLQHVCRRLQWTKTSISTARCITWPI